MVKLGITQFRSDISDVVNRVQYQGERVVLQRQGKSVAVVISVADLEHFERLEDLFDDLEADQAEAESEGQPRIPWEKIKADLDL